MGTSPLNAGNIMTFYSKILLKDLSKSVNTVKPVFSGHSKIDIKDLITNGSLMKVESFAECSF